MKGRVYSIEEKTVFLSPEQAGCFGCMAREHCRKPQLIAAENRTGRNLSPGQVVETEIAKRPRVSQALLSLRPPLAGFTAGFALAGVFFPLSGDGARGAIGIAGLFLAGFAVYALRKRFPDKTRPHIVRVIQPF
ncbi:MAG: SoxR reducing system RseC family protein [Treponema sp.]|jgi:sigma-E factor negative regulatory protein RseC|nr:SoxR reducing system RseC family protein [Treponema sp.]